MNPYVVEREDQDDGSILYMIFDRRGYRFICSTNDDGGSWPHAKRDADLIVQGLNMLARHGLDASEASGPSKDPTQER